MRLLFTVFFALICVTAHAGTQTDSNALGFSADGRYFVFEEFAISDGAGIPSASITIIDTTTDKWAFGSPFKTNRNESDVDESVPTDVALAGVRDEVRKLASKALKPLGDLRKGTVRIHKTPYDFSEAQGVVRFSLKDYHTTLTSSGKLWTLNLATKTFPTRENCFGMAENMTGFSLTLQQDGSDQISVLNDDKRIPKSRPCPFDYRIEQVISYAPNRETTSLGILVRFSSPGFEGPATQLLSIGTQIKQPH